MQTATTATRDRVSLAPLPSLEDADLVRRAREGDELAFEEIVRRYRVPLIRYSARHVGQANAEDVTQHALASAAAHLRDDPRPIHLRAWLYRVAHNAAINMRTRKDFAHEELSVDIDGVPQPPDLAAQRSEVRQVVSELDRLPDRQRTALLLSVFEGLGYDEIASRLDTSPNSVRALLSRARGHLRATAAAIAPLPLLQSLVKKVSAFAGGSGGGQGTVAVGGSVMQAKLVAVAATTVVAGAATAERTVFQGDQPVAPRAAAAAPLPAIPDGAVPLDVESLLPHIAPPPPRDKTAPTPAPVEETSPPEPEPTPQTPLAPEPAAETPPAEAPPAEAPISVEAPPAVLENEAPKEEGSGAEPPPVDESEGPPPDGPPDDGYTSDPPDDGYTPA